MRILHPIFSVSSHVHLLCASLLCFSTRCIVIAFSRAQYQTTTLRIDFLIFILKNPKSIVQLRVFHSTSLFLSPQV